MTTVNLKTKASEALEDGLQATKRALRHKTAELEDLRDAAGLRIRRAPVSSVLMAFAAGLALGCATSMVRRLR
ncbi:hypothetical protein BH24ACI5_BH24ACI5_06790 [soil metagenome]